ncbi:Phosphatidate phosphatase LPIN3 [Trichinella pseudospiralis]|uniref:phosphatidate phosphatase n=1 Tax=Trichinella pseudospiralis TaxID=6337 RepID=A0A0V1EE03_TRIPS|nr:Phosphatidate phosphatase LPIN3 [Trichinella pseudospiralis]
MFSRIFSSVRDFYNGINSATLTGAIDVVVVEQPNGEYIGSSFYVRFGKIGVLQSRAKLVEIMINDQPVDICMRLSSTGEAFFVESITEADVEIPLDLATSPLDCAAESNSEIAAHRKQRAASCSSKFDRFHQLPEQNQRKIKIVTDNSNKTNKNHDVSVADSSTLRRCKSEEVILRRRIKIRQKLIKEQQRKWLDFEAVSHTLSFSSHSAVSVSTHLKRSKLSNSYPGAKRKAAVNMFAEKHVRSLDNSFDKSLQCKKKRSKNKSKKKKNTENNSAKKDQVERFVTPKEATSEMYASDDESSECGDLWSSYSLHNLDDSLIVEDEMANIERVKEEGVALGKVLNDASDWKYARHLVRQNSQNKEDAPESRLWKHWFFASFTRRSHLTTKKKNVQDEIYLQELEAMNSTVSECSVCESENDMLVGDQTEKLDETSEKINNNNNNNNERTMMETEEIVEKSTLILHDGKEDAGCNGIMDVCTVVTEVEQLAETEKGNDSIKSIPELKCALSLCGNLVLEDNYQNITEEQFKSHLLTLEQVNENPSLMFSHNLVVQVNDKYYPSKAGLANIAAISIFGRSLSDAASASLMQLDSAGKLPEHKERTSSGRMTSWFSWRRSSTTRHEGTAKCQNETFNDVKDTASDNEESLLRLLQTSPCASEDLSFNHREALSDSEIVESAEEREARLTPTGTRYQRSLRLTSEQLKSLPLKPGTNKARFSVTTKYQGTCICECYIFVWKWDDKVVVSDIDGTITKSDVLGQILPIMGGQWAQSGVAQLFTRIVDNNYRILYLSARAIGQSTWTKNYLNSVVQDRLYLPDGPLLLSPTSLISALHREIIEKKPEVFKTSCLMEIRALFPASADPFYAGFGNKLNDIIAYKAAGIPVHRMYCIDHRGVIKSAVKSLNLSYPHMTDLVDYIFPPLNRTVNEPVLQSDFPSPLLYANHNYWKLKPYELDAEEKERYQMARTNLNKKSSVAILAGLGIATAGILGRLAVKYGKQMTSKLKNQLDAIPGGAFSKYYQGGFEKKMTRREAFLILGLNANSSKERIRLAHKRVMLLNHPDRGGSPYLAAKINEAKDMLDKGTAR